MSASAFGRNVNPAVETEDRGWWPAAWVIAVLLLALSASLLLFWWWRMAHPSEAMKIISLSRLAGKEYQPAIAPDGETVAFLWQQEEARPPRIWVLPRGAEAPRALTSSAGEYSSPVWSPDGEFIAALRLLPNSGELLIFPKSGGEGRVVSKLLPTRFGLSQRHLDWSPDGEFLLVDDAEKISEPLALYLVSVKTGQRRRISQPRESEIGDIAPRFSPDGKQVAFIRLVNRVSNELLVMPAQGGAPVVVERSTHLISDHSWSADGKSLFFASNRDGEYRIWRVRAGANATPRATSVYGEFAIQFALPRKSKALVYAVVQDRINIWRFDLADSPDPSTRWKRVIASAGQDRSPQYSPDGQRVAFRSDRGGEDSIWVVSLDSDETSLVTREHMRPSVPRWRPDGHGLVFHSAETSRIYVAEESQGKWSVRDFGATGVHPVYSPDGKWIYAGSPDSILRYPAAGGKAENIAPTRAISLGISADGRFLFFVREPKGTTLWRFDLETREMTRVLDGLVPYCGSCWALSGNVIYYLGVRADEPNQQAIYRRDFDKDEPPREVVRYPEAVFPIGIGPFSVTPDGRYFLCVRVDSSDSDLLRIDTFQ